MEELISYRKISKYEKTKRSNKNKKLAITERGRQVLIALYHHRCLTTRQIAQIYFQYDQEGNFNLSAETIARKHLRRLLETECVERFFVDVGQLGTSQGYYLLAPKGAAMVAEWMQIPLKKLNWKYQMNRAKLPYLEHLVKINEFYTNMFHAARDNGHEVVGFKAEHHCKHKFKYWGEEIICNPDAYGQYWYSEDEGIHFFLELDNDTMTLPTFQKKQQRYAAFYATKEYEEEYKEFPLILTVAPTIERALQLRDAIYSIDKTDLNWLFACEFDIEMNPLGHIWYGREENPISLIKR